MMCSISIRATGTGLEVADDQARFWALFQRLPDGAQERAQRAYAQFRDNPGHPGLQFKRMSNEEPLYSARIGIQHRAVGSLKGDAIT